MSALSEHELVRQAGSTPERIRQLVELSLLAGDGDGRFGPADVQRVQIIAAYEQGGISVEDLAEAVRERRITFDYSDRIYPAASPPSGRTVGDLITELGPRGALLPDVLAALGLPRPSADGPLTQADETVLPAFVRAWSAVGMVDEAPLRAARMLGEATRRATEGWVDLFMEAIDLDPERRATMSVDVLGPRLFEPAAHVAQLLEPMMVWLLRRHMEQALNALNVESMERALEVHGGRPVSRETPAIVFADLSGFTRLTDEYGDHVAMRHASTLARLSVAAAEAHNGRLVKQLGDGVMLAFGQARDAVAAALELRRRAEEEDLPPLHTGISAGPVVERDGDFYGRTVNLASRISAIAAPGEVLANRAAAEAAQAVTLVPLGETVLKGVSTAVPLFRLDADGDGAGG
jgi:class 3 adenylate cyclase